MKAIIDFDSGVYAIASACDGRKWCYRGRQWETKKVAERVLLSEGKDIGELRMEKFPEPWPSVEKTVHRYVDNFLSKLETTFDFEFYIKGGGNFRFPLATILPYKDGRDSEPVHREAISEMMAEEYYAKRVYNVEVDDALGILSGPEDIVLVHIDKDIEQVPGHHFNPDKGEAYEIDEIEGLRRFYKQLIIGDSTDSILGLFGVGAKSTHVKKLDLMCTEEEMYDHVYLLYLKRFGTYAPSFMKENARLAWMMRGDSRVYYWMSSLLNGEEIDFYLNPYDTMEIK